jgi:2-iminobutanoate/2-iminopropanoate deaminase
MLKGSDGLFYSSGILPEIKNDQMASVEFSDQMKEIFWKIKTELEKNGLTFTNLLRVKIMLEDMYLYSEMNEIYSEFFKEIEVMPVRECKSYSGLPFEARIEVSFIADPGKNK